MAKPKVLAFFLPQFHRILENDIWWGDGFTEWTNVRKAVPLFYGHLQPKVPWNHEYFDLTNISVLRSQCELANSYGVDGFAIYHYWFDGKLLLEKPAEILLANNDVQTEFCFTWANEPWSRTWEGRDREVLISQTYGDRDAIVRHFEYLLPFFLDPRYIKIDKKPIFMIYRAESVTNLDFYFDIFDELSKKYGFNGVHWIFGNTVFNNRSLEGKYPDVMYYDLQPQEAIGRRSLFRKVYERLFSRSIGFINFIFGSTHPLRFYSYDDIWKSILTRSSSPRVYYGCFVDWDNSPRRSWKGTIFRGFSVLKFYNFFRLLYSRSVVENKDFLFINAWNEWAEGAFLQPDVETGYSKLEMIKKVVDSHND